MHQWLPGRTYQLWTWMKTDGSAVLSGLPLNTSSPSGVIVLLELPVHFSLSSWSHGTIQLARMSKGNLAGGVFVHLVLGFQPRLINERRKQVQVSSCISVTVPN
uniref:(northern house mosquito) hypothetical protein n=1 Tax=Culex pipiens TaxID=7175 RepID=A0A8D8CNV5_CULPI